MNDQPVVFVHGERIGKQHYIHFFAFIPGHKADAITVLKEIIEKAHADGIEGFCSPSNMACGFYAGYIGPFQPCHPHWTVEGTEALVEAGFLLTTPSILMSRDLRAEILLQEGPPSYEMKEEVSEEFLAKAFRYATYFEGKEVAACSARLYPHLKSHGSPVGHIGFIGTDMAHRGRGLARIQVLLCLKRLKEWGGKEPLLEVDMDNPSAIDLMKMLVFILLIS